MLRYIFCLVWHSMTWLHSSPDNEQSFCRDFLANTVAGTLSILVRGAKNLPACDVSTDSGLLCASGISIIVRS